MEVKIWYKKLFLVGKLNNEGDLTDDWLIKELLLQSLNLKAPVDKNETVVSS